MKKIFFGFVTLTTMMNTTFATQKVVYGVDNRFELSASPFSELKLSVAGMMSKYGFSKFGDDLVIPYFTDLTTYKGKATCEDMRFREQPTAAACTGFLIDEETLVTAGHCMLNYGQKVNNTKTYKCNSNVWVFGYDTNSADTGMLTFPKDDVYECDKVIAGSYTYDLDYAVIKLKRKTIGKTPVKMSGDKENYKVGEQLFVVGHPTGLPIKISAGAKVVKNGNDSRFVTNLDTFAGNSGSPVFNFYGEAIGILVSGEVDYTFDSERQCYKVNECTKYGGKCESAISKKASGETATKIQYAIDAMKE